MKEEEKQKAKQNRGILLSKGDKKIIADFHSSLSDNQYQLKCTWAIRIIESKLSMIGLELKTEKNREVIVRTTDRIKTAESIFLKLRRKGYTINLDNAKKKLNDIIGVRATCMFQDDIYDVIDCLNIQEDLKIVKIKDYIKTPRSSGYQSVHIIIEVPVYLKKKPEWMKVELQLRTVAMDSWSELDYQLLYKKEYEKADEISKELKRYANIIADMDISMMRLRDMINEI